MSNVYLFALAGLNSARRAQVVAARTISLDYAKPAPPTPRGYGPAPRDRVEITGGRGQTPPVIHGPRQAGGASPAPAGDVETAAAQMLAARQAFAASARVLEAHATAQRALLDVTA